MKTVYWIFFIAFFTPNIGFSEPIKVTVYVDDAYHPYSFLRNGKAQGIYIDVLKTAFSKMKKFSVKLDPIPWNRGKEMMEQGKGFALTPAYFHGHDWPYLYPYSLPFYNETVVVACTNKVIRKTRSSWPYDYVGLIIGSVAGFDGWGGQAFRQLVKKNKIKLHEVQSSEALIRMLIKKRVDCIMMEKGALFHIIKSNADVVTNFSISAELETDPVYIGYSEKALHMNTYPFSQMFRKEFDIVIYSMKKSGEIDRIMRAYVYD
jgi:polar amino acid transport system substrate-binding protein